MIATVIRLMILSNGYVAQIGLRLCFPLPRTDLAYGDGARYAKSCEAV